MATSTGYYLYGFTDCPRLEDIHTDAVAGNGHIQNIPFKGIGVLCSPVNGKKLTPSRKNLMNHQLVLETMLKKQTVLPIRFGVVAQSKRALYNGIESNLPIIRANLHKFSNKIELNIKAFWDKDFIYDHIKIKYPEVKRYRNVVRKMKSTTAHFRSIDLGKMVERYLIAEGEREAAEIIQKVEHCTLQIKKNKIIGEFMFLNLAALVNIEYETDLDEAVNKIASDLVGKVRIKYVGPSAPSSFANIYLKF